MGLWETPANRHGFWWRAGLANRQCLGQWKGTVVNCEREESVTRALPDRADVLEALVCASVSPRRRAACVSLAPAHTPGYYWIQYYPTSHGASPNESPDRAGRT